MRKKNGRNVKKSDETGVMAVTLKTIKTAILVVPRLIKVAVVVLEVVEETKGGLNLGINV